MHTFNAGIVQLTLTSLAADGLELCLTEVGGRHLLTDGKPKRHLACHIRAIQWYSCHRCAHELVAERTRGRGRARGRERHAIAVGADHVLAAHAAFGR